MGFFPILLPIQSSYPFLQIPLWARCGCLADFVALADEDVFGEGANVVGFQKKDVIAEVQKRPVHPFFGELLFENVHLVVRGDGEDLHGVLPLVVQTAQFRKLSLTDGRHTVHKL